MNNKPFIFILLTILFVMPKAYSQDPLFSQFYANPLYLNPALAGATICPRAIANFRDQWPSIGGAFVTYNASYDQYINGIHGGIGVMVTADRQGGGALNMTTISAMYAYKFNLSSRIVASAALQVGYFQRHLAFDKLVFGDMIDPATGNVDPGKTLEKPPDNPTVGAPDFSTGIFLDYDEKFYGGISVSHLSQPNIGFYATGNDPLYMKFTVHGGTVINLKQSGFGEDREFSISPNILYQQQFKYHQLDLGVYVTVDPFIGGLWFRHNFENADALTPLVGVHYKNLRVGYSYDLTLSRLKGSSGGAHEVSASWQFPCVEKRRHIRAIKCPRF
jgi:type IX secretion system PorP/SprF family membrane protein